MADDPRRQQLLQGPRGGHGDELGGERVRVVPEDVALGLAVPLASGVEQAAHGGVRVAFAVDLVVDHADVEAPADSDVVVEISGDCPVLDPLLVEQNILMYVHNPCDYAAYKHGLSPPAGTGDSQVFSLDALRRAAEMTQAPPDREHPTRFIQRNPDVFSLLYIVEFLHFFNLYHPFHPHYHFYYHNYLHHLTNLLHTFYEFYQEIFLIFYTGFQSFLLIRQTSNVLI